MKSEVINTKLLNQGISIANVMTFLKTLADREYYCYYEKVGKNEPVKLEDLPFDIPDTWAWARLGNIVEFENGDRSQKYPVESDYVSVGIATNIS